MSKIFDNLDFGTHFKDEYGTRWIKLNCNSTYQHVLPFFQDHTGCRRSFNAVDYNGLMDHLPFDLAVEEIPNPNLTPLTNQGLDISNPSDIISSDLNNGLNENNNSSTNNQNNMNTATTAVSTTPQLTLKEAVVQAATELKNKGAFSAYDVTTAVREAANSGEFALPGLEAKQNNSNIKYWVNHEDVKQVVDGLLNDGTLATLGLTNVNYNGSFRVFEFATSVAPSSPVTSSTPASTTANPTQSPVAQRIQTYLSNAGSATLKQVQSALKVNGVTCKDLAAIVAGLGFSVTPGTTDCYSTYTVS